LIRKCMTRFSSGSHSKEGARVGSNVVLENPTHAQWQQFDRRGYLKSMKTIYSPNGLITHDSSGSAALLPIADARWRMRRRDSLPLSEAIPLWFALSSPLTGLVLGLLGAWFVTWLTS